MADTTSGQRHGWLSNNGEHRVDLEIAALYCSSDCRPTWTRLCERQATIGVSAGPDKSFVWIALIAARDTRA